MDPPRAGSTPEFLAGAAALAPERIVYISCNPATPVSYTHLRAAGGERRRFLVNRKTGYRENP